MSRSKPPNSDPEYDRRALLDPIVTPTLKPGQVEQVLGISRSSVYKMITNGTLPVIFLGGLKSTRVRTIDLLDYLGISHEHAANRPSGQPVECQTCARTISPAPKLVIPTLGDLEQG